MKIRSRMFLSFITMILTLGCMACGEEAETPFEDKNRNEITTDPESVNGMNPSIQMSDDITNNSSISTTEISEINPEGRDVIRWAVPIISEKVLEERQKVLNYQLFEDGYPYYVIFESVSTYDYNEKISETDVDIATVGMDNNWGSVQSKDIIDAGTFVCLDQFLNESVLSSIIPDVMWESVRRNGKINSIPNIFTNAVHQITVLADINQISEDKIESFQGDIYELDDLLTNDRKILYDEDIWNVLIGSDYLVSKGLIMNRQTELVNPFETDEFGRWETTFQDWNERGLVARDSMDQWAIVITTNADLSKFNLEYDNKKCCLTELFTLSGAYVPTQTSFSIGIKSTSQKVDEAFELLTLLLTEEKYGNLLIYGKQNPVEFEKEDYSFLKMVFGLNDFIAEHEDGALYFATPEERRQFYDKVILMDLTAYEEQEEYQQLNKLTDRYEKLERLTRKEVIQNYDSQEDYQKELLQVKEEIARCIEALK